ncbi:MAG: hypothetical protein O3A85_03075 [Proteobacteria bacterium]|nr:hypothetical protein [Pseudomonadota bacterium]
MPLRKLIAVCIAFFSLTSVTVGEEQVQPYRYVSGEKFLSWPSVSRIDYVTGIVDALSYLTESTGIQRGISDCFKESDPKAWGPITWQLITKDAVVEAVAKEGTSFISVPKVLFEKMKLICPDQYLKQ